MIRTSGDCESDLLAPGTFSFIKRVIEGRRKAA